jgi:hypothetical protein
VAGYTLLTSGFDGTDTNSYTTASIAVTAQRPVLMIVENALESVSTTPTVTGATQTWANRGSEETTGGTIRRRLTALTCHPTSSSSGPLTIGFGATKQYHCGWHVIQLNDVVNTDAIEQIVIATGNSFGLVTVTLAAFARALNATLGTFIINNQSTLTEGSGFGLVQTTTGAADDAPFRWITEFRADNDTTVDATIGGTTNRRYVGIGIELRGALTPALIDSTASIFTPSVSVTVLPGLIDQTAVIFAPAVVLGAVSITPAVIDQSAQMFGISFTTGAPAGQVLIPGRAMWEEAGEDWEHSGQVWEASTIDFLTYAGEPFTPEVVEGGLSVAPDLIDNTGSIEDLGYVNLPQTVFLSSLNQAAEAFPFGMVTTQDVSPGLIDHSAVVFAPALGAPTILAPTLLDHSGQTFDPELAIAEWLVEIDGILGTPGATFAPQFGQETFRMRVEVRVLRRQTVDVMVRGG